jgi:AcrR family transcriptional regulator
MSRSEQKLQTRKRILDAAGRAFRQGGFGGIGVDGLAKEAGVTSGAFYKHFDSKSAAFREVVTRGVSDVAEGIEHFQKQHGEDWWNEFVRFYLGERRKCALPESCGLQSLATDVARADDSARHAFTSEFLKVASAIGAGDAADAPSTLEETYAALATLVGAVTLARAVDDPAVAKKIAAAAEHLLLASSRPAPKPRGRRLER